MSETHDEKAPSEGMAGPTNNQDFGLVGKGAGFIPTGDANAMPEGGSQGKRDGRGRRFVVRTLVPLLVLAAILGGGYFWWSHLRPVQVTVNGTLQRVTVGTTIDQLKSDEGIQTAPGNYVSVSGNILAEGEGYPYSVIVNDKDMDYDEASAYKVSGGERISVGDGKDRMEPYTTETVNQPPRLLMDGNVGAINYISQWGATTVKDVLTGQESGEQADGTVYQQGQDCVITVKDVKPAGSQKLVALTFDDGPSSNTAAILDTLAQYNVKATFFVIGNESDEMKTVYQRIVDEGHTLGMHSYSNSYSKIYSSPEAFGKDVAKLNAYLKEITGEESKYYRFPGGSNNEISNADMSEFIHVLNEKQITYFDWNVSAGDTASDYSAQDIVTNVTEGVSKYKTSVVLLHDGDDKSTTVEALGPLIEALQKMKAKILPIDENTNVIQYIKADSVE